ncbi:MAG: glycosyl transferase family 1 [Paenibacillaceae bacterium]|jgi:hypothetical protein|nr:glycosyl transferase family 1 [Paenibacillaceae bacterium]
MKPHIVFVINYFYPDYASTGQLLTELCLHIQKDFRITVIAAMAENGEQGPAADSKSRFAKEQLEDITIIRVKLPKVDKSNKWSRLRYIASYFLYASLAMLRQKKVDFIYTISSPPILGGLIGTIGKRLLRAKHIYNIQDFNPEQAEAVSFMKSKKLYSIARWVDTFNCKQADHIITVGLDMQQTLFKRLAAHSLPANTVINNWTDEQAIVPLDKAHPKVARFLEQHGLTGKFVVMYSGNMGLYYDLENLIKVTESFSQYPDIAFVFIGDGAVKKRMQAYVEDKGLSGVHFLPFQPKEELVYSLNAADVHLVVNQKGIKGVSVPSKIYGVMAAGRTVLGVLEEGSEAYRLIRESGCGVVVEPQQYGEVASNLRTLYGMDQARLAAYGLSGRMYLEQYLRRDISLEKYRKLLLSMSGA